jgi:hypothetical protein
LIDECGAFLRFTAGTKLKLIDTLQSSVLVLGILIRNCHGIVRAARPSKLALSALLWLSNGANYNLPHTRVARFL